MVNLLHKKAKDKEPLNTGPEVEESVTTEDSIYQRLVSEGLEGIELSGLTTINRKGNEVLSTKGKTIAEQIWQDLFQLYNGDLNAIRNRLAEDYQTNIRDKYRTHPLEAQRYMRLYQSLNAKLQYAASRELAAQKLGKSIEELGFEEIVTAKVRTEGESYEEMLTRAQQEMGRRVEIERANGQINAELLTYEAQQKRGVGDERGRVLDGDRLFKRFRTTARQVVPQAVRVGLTSVVVAQLVAAAASPEGRRPAIALEETTPAIVQVVTPPEAPADHVPLVDIPTDTESPSIHTEPELAAEVVQAPRKTKKPNRGHTEVLRDDVAHAFEQSQEVRGNESRRVSEADLVVYYPVGATTAVPESYSRHEAPLPLVEVEGKEVAEIISAPLTQLLADARAQGFKPVLSSGFRSQQYQQWTRQEGIRRQVEDNGMTPEQAEAYVAENSAQPGYSEHHLATAVDITDTPSGLNSWDHARENYNVGFYKWLREHAHEYGFVLSYPTGADSIDQAKPGSGYVSAEPWHVRYVGQEQAQELFDSGYLDPTNSVTVDKYLRGLYEQTVSSGIETINIVEGNLDVRNTDYAKLEAEASPYGVDKVRISENGGYLWGARKWKDIDTSELQTYSTVDRTPDRYREIVSQFNVEDPNNERYQPKVNDTSCNTFVADVTSVLYAEYPGLALTHWRNGKEMSANEYYQWLKSAEASRQYGWTAVSQADALELAGKGIPVVGVVRNTKGFGHMWIVMPTPEGSTYPHVAQAGARTLFDKEYDLSVLDPSRGYLAVNYYVNRVDLQGDNREEGLAMSTRDSQVNERHDIGTIESSFMVKKAKEARVDAASVRKDQRARQTVQAQKAKAQATAFQGRLDRRG